MSEPAYRVDGRLVTEAAFYSLACDPQRHVVVEACAGAGKTWMLVSRILRALLEGVEPEQILAVTYTRKAAGEMRARLNEWLQGYAENQCSHADRIQALQQRGLKPDRAQALASSLAELHGRLLQRGRSVEIRTFHAWFGQLLSQAPAQVLSNLGLPAMHELLEDFVVLESALFRRVHRRVRQDPALHAAYSAVLGRRGRSSLRLWLTNAWKRGPEICRADAMAPMEAAVPSASQCWNECEGLADPAELLFQTSYGESLVNLARQLGRAKGVKAREAALKLELALQEPDAGQRFSQVWAALWTKDGEPRKLGEHSLLPGAVSSLQRIALMRQQQEAHVEQAQMLSLTRVLLAEYAALKRERGLVDMSDLERAAEVLLGDAALAGWMQERLDLQVRQVMIDEFQDTSPLQWQALHAWLSAYAGAGGGASGQRAPGIFIVGDPKQSIYRFRGAEPRVFAAAQEFVQEGLEGHLLSCDHTRRNAAAVIEAVNTVFEDAARLDGWTPFQLHSTDAEAAGRVLRLRGSLREDLPDKSIVKSGHSALAHLGWRDSLTEPLRPAELKLRELEARQAAAAVADLVGRQGFKPQEVMVLARQRSALARVAQALAVLDVPHVVAEALLLHQNPEALDLVAVLDVLASPGHDLALARALRSPLFGAGSDDLLWLSQRARSEGFKSWLHTLLAAGDAPEALARARELFTAWRSLLLTHTPHDLLDTVVHDSDALARVAAAVPPAQRPAALHAMAALQGAALAHGGARFATVYGFVREIKAGRVKAQAAAPIEAVQLLTVHGAKGLEARAVLVLDSDPGNRPTERAHVLVDWPAHARAPLKVAFVYSPATLAPSLQPVWDGERLAQDREETNGLYVAMTRAREQLIFSRTEPHLTASRQRSWWARCAPHSQLWEPVAARQRDVGREDTVAVPCLPELVRAPDATTAEALRPPADDAPLARLGQAVHRVLEWVGQPGRRLPESEWPALCLSAARSFGVESGSLGRVQSVVASILKSPTCRRFFDDTALHWAGNEVPVAVEGRTLRIDRLVALRSGQRLHWWVLDYKLHHSPQEMPAHRQQLQAYVQAVRALSPGDAVSGAFITGDGQCLPLES